MTKLSDLDPQFIKDVDDRRFNDVDELSHADGIMFLCPKCFATNNGPVGTHSIICWSPSVPQDRSPKPGRWEMRGTGYNDLSLVAGSSSVLLTGGCRAHFFVQNGQIVDC